MDKEYDWIMANIANPKFNGVDFRVIGDLTVDNTLFMDMDYYLKSPKILANSMFKDDNGNFDENRFRIFYGLAVNKFMDFTDLSIVDNYEYSPYDIRRPLHSLTSGYEFLMYAQLNPTHTTIGVGGFNKVGDSGLSPRELALLSEIVDGKTGKGLGYSVNDMALFGGSIGKFIRRTFFPGKDGDPLVYATYDEDTEEFDPYSGNMVKHLKGEYKVNSNGEFYTETLAGRDLLGKDVVSMFDYLTVDGSLINKYDFFDADGLNKSIGSTILRSAATLLPLVNPTTGLIYSIILLTKSMMEIAPMLVGVTEGALGNQDVSSPFWDTVSAWGKKFTLSLSDYDRMNTFTWNNIVNLAGDLGTIFASQGLLVKGITSLRGNSKAIMLAAEIKAQKEYLRLTNAGIKKLRAPGGNPEFTRLSGVGKLADLEGEKSVLATGRWMETPYGQEAISKYIPKALKTIEQWQLAGLNASLVYFALMLNTGLFEELRMRGVDPQEAALITLGSIAATFTVDKYLKLGTMFFLTPPEQAAVRAVAKSSAEDMIGAVANDLPKATGTDLGKLKFIGTGIEKGRAAISKFADGLRNNTLSTVGKAFGEGLMRSSEELVLDVSKQIASVLGEMGYFKETDYGEWENMLERYGMTYLGGALGGAAFDIIGKIKMANNADNKLTNSAIYLIRNGYKDDLLKAYKDLYNRGFLGSKTLSHEAGPDGSAPFTVSNERLSQGYYVYLWLVKAANNLEAMLNRNKVNLSDKEVMIRSGLVSLSLIDYLNGDGKAAELVSYFTNIYRDFLRLVALINDVERRKDDIKNRDFSDSERGSKPFKEEWDDAEANRQQLLNLRDYLFGEGSLGYAEEMLFVSDPDTFSNFGDINFTQYVRKYYGKSPRDLTSEENTKYQNEFNKSMQHRDVSIHLAFLSYKRGEKLITPLIKNMSDAAKRYAAISEVRTAYSNYLRDLKGWDDIFDFDTEEDYRDRSVLRPGEEYNDYVTRHNTRQGKINDYLGGLVNNLMDRLEGKYLTTNDQRLLERLFNMSTEKVKDSFRKEYINLKNIPLRDAIRNVVARNTVFGDYVSMAEEIRQLMYSSYKQEKLSEYGDPDKNYTPYREQLEWWLSDRVEDGSPYIKDITNNDIERMILNRIGEGAPYPLTPEAVEENMTVEWQPMPFDLSLQGTRNRAARDYCVALFNSLNNGDTVTESRLRKEHGDDVVLVTPMSLEKGVNDQIGIYDLDGSGTGDLLYIMNRIYAMDDAIYGDKLYNALLRFERLLFVRSPIVEMMQYVSGTLNGVTYNVEHLLMELNDMYRREPDHSRFLLTPDLATAVKLFIRDLEAAKVYFKAACEGRHGAETSIGHNEAINNFIAENRSKFPKAEWLPTINYEQWKTIDIEIDNYITELDRWLSLSEKNAGNRGLSILNTNKAIDKALIDYWRTNGGAFSFDHNGATINLMAGVSFPMGEPTFSDVANIENQVRANFMAVYKTDPTVLNSLVDWLIKNDNPHRIAVLADLLMLRTARLDTQLTYSDFTGWDRVSYLITTIAIDNVEYFLALKNYYQTHPNIIPSRALEYVARMGYAERNSKIPQLFMKIVYSKTEGKFELPLYPNTTVVAGRAGTGKSAVASSLILKPTDKIIVSGPTETLVAGLLKAFEGRIDEKNIRPMTKDLLLDMVIKSDINKALIKEPKFGKETAKLYRLVAGLEGTYTIKLAEGIEDKINKIDKDKPNLIIVDEATWFNTVELALLTKFAEVNSSPGSDIHVVLIGDMHQNGFDKNRVHNLGREESFAWRTPLLETIIRADNSQKVSNQRIINSMLDTIESTTSQEELVRIEHDISLQLSDLRLSYFEKDDGTGFCGDRIEPMLTDRLMNMMNGTIAFVGAESSKAYETLRLHFDRRGITVVRFDPDKILGLEFDYVVIDKTWATKFSEKPALHVRDIDTFLRDLNTMNTRSRVGGIIISSELADVIGGSMREGTTTLLGDLGKEAERYLPIRIDELTRALSGMGIKSVEPEPEDKTPKVLDDGSTESEKKEISEKTDEDSMVDKSKEVVDESVGAALTDLSKAVGEVISPTKSEIEISEEDGTFIPGAPLTQYSLELGPIIRNSVLSLETIDNVRAENYRLILNPETPVRVYGNVHVSGISILGEHWHSLTNEEYLNKYGKEKESCDLDIFLKDGLDIKSLIDKDIIINKFLALKGTLFCRDQNGKILLNFYDIMDPRDNETLKIFTIDDLNNAKYVVRSVKADYLNKIIPGTSDLDDALRGIGYGKQMVLLLLKIEGRRKDGGEGKQSYFVTLGAFASPEKWSRGDNALEIRRALERVVETLGNDSPEAHYLNDFNNITSRYNAFIDEFTLAENYFELENNSDLVKMSTATNLYRREKPVRLVDPRDDTSPYAEETKGSRSDVFVVNDPEELKVKDRNKGKPVTYVSYIQNLDTKTLVTRYELLKEGFDGLLSGLVRMIVLDNIGLSYKLLGDLRLHRLLAVLRKNAVHLVPVELGITGVRMYVSMWNFRTALDEFKLKYENWRDNTMHMTDAEINSILDLENWLYEETQNQRQSLNISHLDVIEMADTYLKGGSMTLRQYDRLLVLWNFNDKELRNVRWFRLGKAKERTGVYIRRMIGAEMNPHYEEYKGDERRGIRPTDINGVYLDYDMVKDFSRTVKSLFDNLVDLIIPPPLQNGERANVYLEDHLLKLLTDLPTPDDETMLKNWYDAIRTNKKFVFLKPVFEEDGSLKDDGVTITVESGSLSDSFRGLASAMIQLQENMYYYSRYGRVNRKGTMRINGKNIPWEAINESFELEDEGVIKKGLFTDVQSGHFENYPRGFSYYKTENGLEVGKKDYRFDNLMSLIFHGRPIANEFDGNDPFATDAYFKYGFFTDPVYAIFPDENGNKAANNIPVSSHESLYTSDVVAGFPLIGLSERIYEVWNQVKTGARPAVLPDVVVENLPQERALPTHLLDGTPTGAMLYDGRPIALHVNELLSTPEYPYTYMSLDMTLPQIVEQADLFLGGRANAILNGGFKDRLLDEPMRLNADGTHTLTLKELVLAKADGKDIITLPIKETSRYTVTAIDYDENPNQVIVTVASREEPNLSRRFKVAFGEDFDIEEISNILPEVLSTEDNILTIGYQTKKIRDDILSVLSDNNVSLEQLNEEGRNAIEELNTTEEFSNDNLHVILAIMSSSLRLLISESDTEIEPGKISLDTFYDMVDRINAIKFNPC